MTRHAVETVCEIIERHADRGGMVNVRGMWRDLRDLSFDPVDVQDIIRGLERTAYLWRWGEWIILPRPVRCPACKRWVEQRLTAHMRNDHPRRTGDVAWVEWAD